MYRCHNAPHTCELKNAIGNHGSVVHSMSPAYSDNMIGPCATSCARDAVFVAIWAGRAFALGHLLSRRTKEATVRLPLQYLQNAHSISVTFSITVLKQNSFKIHMHLQELNEFNCYQHTSYNEYCTTNTGSVKSTCDPAASFFASKQTHGSIRATPA